MLTTWGGDGNDTINQEEFTRIGFDKAMKYHKEYCWYYGYGFCKNCALDKYVRANKGTYSWRKNGI